MATFNAEQQYFLVTVLCYIFGVVAMYRFPPFKPFKLLAVVRPAPPRRRASSPCAPPPQATARDARSSSTS